MEDFPNYGPDNSPNPWKKLSTETAYENPWIRVRHEEVLNPSGGPGIYGVVHFKNTAIGILPIDEDEHTWLIGQYRYPLDRYSWEIPEGGGPIGSSLLESAQRELREETGLTASKWRPLLDTHISNSVTDEFGVAFIAQGLSQGESAPEETEALQVKRLPLSEAIEMALSGDISDSLSQLCLMKAAIWKQKGLL